MTAKRRKNCASSPKKSRCRRFTAIRKETCCWSAGDRLTVLSRRGVRWRTKTEKSRRTALASFASVAERARENLQKFKRIHRRDERPGRLRLRQLARFCVRATANKKSPASPDRRSHIPVKEILDACSRQVMRRATHPASRREVQHHGTAPKM